MTTAADRLNQLQQYINYYRTGGSGQGNGSNVQGYGFGNPDHNNSNSYDPNVNPYAHNNQAQAWAQGMMDKQDAQQQLEDQNATFKGMYSGNGQSLFGPPPAYVQPNNQQQQPNPYSARAMQLNSGGGGAESNSLAQMFRNGNYKAGG